MAYPVTVIQTNIENGEVDANRQHIMQLVSQAAAKGARLIVLPEACTTDIHREAAGLAEPIPGATTELIARAAENAVVALPLLERSNGSVFSSCALIAKDGIKGIARKSHLYRDPTGHDSFRDAEIMAAGAELSIVDLGDVRAGVLIGFDAEFPEAFRALALRGADFIIVALNQIAPDLPFLCAMARRNRIPLLVANRIGFRRVYPGVPEFSALTMSLVQEKNGAFLARCRGGSAIIDADGRVMAEPSQNVQRDLEAVAGAPPGAIVPLAHFQEDELLTASFRIDELRLQRLSSPFISERREELYGLAKPVAAAAPEAKPKKPRKKKSDSPS
jgi:predicted amidohydrolase